MKRIAEITGLSLFSMAIVLAGPSGATSKASPQSKSCWAQAKEQGLVGADRTAFHATCMKGALAPKGPTEPKPTTRAAAAVTSPSGADRTTRSKQCNDEAERRGLHDSAFQSFRKGCLASAAPVSAIETSRTPTTPTPAKPKLESLTNTPPH